MLILQSIPTRKKSYQKWRLLYNIISRLGIKDENTAIQSQSCLEHNSLEVLKEIHCPTLILGALEEGRVWDGSKELAKAIFGLPAPYSKHFWACSLWRKIKHFKRLSVNFLIQKALSFFMLAKSQRDLGFLPWLRVKICFCDVSIRDLVVHGHGNLADDFACSFSKNPNNFFVPVDHGFEGTRRSAALTCPRGMWQQLRNSF